jgi:hypothetical protein
MGFKMKNVPSKSTLQEQSHLEDGIIPSGCMDTA